MSATVFSHAKSVLGDLQENEVLKSIGAHIAIFTEDATLTAMLWESLVRGLTLTTRLHPNKLMRANGLVEFANSKYYILPAYRVDSARGLDFHLIYWPASVVPSDRDTIHLRQMIRNAAWTDLPLLGIRTYGSLMKGPAE